ncbi:MAG: S24 family peptidase [Alphaproteobacteria bacterium]|nr:S24 family peptidase [Alphaproteobacteria bacterium]
MQNSHENGDPCGHGTREEKNSRTQFYTSEATILPRDGASIHHRKPPALQSHGRITQPFGAPRDLPVLGRAQGGSDGNIVIDNTAIDWTFRPADLQGVKDAFAVFVTGDSMLPKYKPQDLAYVRPRKPPQRGRYVLVETADHSGFIKQFVKWDGATLVLKQFNPAQEVRIPREHVRKVLLVIGSLDA